MQEHAWILVIDDDVAVRTQLPIAIRQASENCLVEAAFDGPAGVKKALHGNYVLIFTDDEMPGFGCDEVVRNVLEHNPDVPIYIISEDDQRKEVKKALEAGARGIVHKPLDNSQIQEIVEAEVE